MVDPEVVMHKHLPGFLWHQSVFMTTGTPKSLQMQMHSFLNKKKKNENIEK